MAIRSVRGMTIGSPEFVATVKAAEKESEVSGLIGRLEDDVERLLFIEDGFTTSQHIALNRIKITLIEVLDGW